MCPCPAVPSTWQVHLEVGSCSGLTGGQGVPAQRDVVPCVCVRGASSCWSPTPPFGATTVRVAQPQQQQILRHHRLHGENQKRAEIRPWLWAVRPSLHPSGAAQHGSESHPPDWIPGLPPPPRKGRGTACGVGAMACSARTSLDQADREPQQGSEGTALLISPDSWAVPLGGAR